MEKELSNVIDRLNKLPQKKQKSLAKLIADEISWEERVTKSENALASLAAEAVEEYKKGKTKPMDF